MRGAVTPPPTHVPTLHREGGGPSTAFRHWLVTDIRWTRRRVGPTVSAEVMPNTKTSVPLGTRKLVIHRPVQSPCHHHSPSSAQEAGVQPNQ